MKRGLVAASELGLSRVDRSTRRPCPPFLVIDVECDSKKSSGLFSAAFMIGLSSRNTAGCRAYSSRPSIRRPRQGLAPQRVVVVQRA